MGQSTDPALEEVHLFHDHLEAWLGRGAPEAWTYLTGAFDPDFELIAIDGGRVCRPDLLEALRGQGADVPGLEIEVLEPQIHLQDARHMWVTFLERHSTGATRFTTAFLVRTSSSPRWLWRFVQETLAPNPSH